MLGILDVILPVFLLIGAGYASVYAGIFSDAAVDALMRYAQLIAIPALLFMAVARLDLGSVFSWTLILSYYVPALIVFFIGVLIARLFFERSPGASVSIGFTALFSNSVLLGLPIMERAYGTDALHANYAIISIHAPFCYIVGITMMEILRADGRTGLATARIIVSAVFKNSLAIGLMLGFVVNFSNIPLPRIITSPIDMLVQSALPIALFALGGIMVRYQFKNNLPEVAALGVLKLVVFPSLVFVLSVYVFDLNDAQRNSLVITAAMAPGVNTFIFANMYNRGKATAASAVVILTALSVISITGWLVVLGT